MDFKPSLAERLRKQSPIYLSSLPDVVRIPALSPSRPDDVVRSLAEATLDDLAFAIQALESEFSVIHRRCAALKELSETARKRGAVGSTTVADAFAHVARGEAYK